MKYFLLLSFVSTLGFAESTVDQKTDMAMQIIDRVCDQNMKKRISYFADHSKIIFSCKKDVSVEILMDDNVLKYIKAELKQNGKYLLVLDSPEDIVNKLEQKGPITRICRQLAAIYENTEDNKKTNQKNEQERTQLRSIPKEASNSAALIKALFD